MSSRDNRALRDRDGSRESPDRLDDALESKFSKIRMRDSMSVIFALRMCL
jgi:hypothetical protein